MFQIFLLPKGLDLVSPGASRSRPNGGTSDEQALQADSFEASALPDEEPLY